MNKDIVRKISETSRSASLEDIKYIRNIVLNTAQFYTQRLIDYICNNSANFPEYNTNSNGDMSPSKEGYFNGMNLTPYNPRTSEITINDFLTSDISPS